MQQLQNGGDKRNMTIDCLTGDGHNEVKQTPRTGPSNMQTYKTGLHFITSTQDPTMQILDLRPLLESAHPSFFFIDALALHESMDYEDGCFDSRQVGIGQSA